MSPCSTLFRLWTEKSDQSTAVQRRDTESQCTAHYHHSVFCSAYSNFLHLYLVCLQALPHTSLKAVLAGVELIVS